MSNAISVELEDEGKNLENGLEKVLGLGEKQATQPTQPSTTESTDTPDCGPWGCEGPKAQV